MAIYTSVLTAGTNSHAETSENINGLATDFVSQGIIGPFTNTGGVAPMTGAFAVNAQGTPNMTVAVSSGVAYVTATPASQDSQTLRVRMTANQNVTISANTSGSTKYDWLYIALDASKAANPASDASDVATLYVSRSSSSTSDNGTPPAFGYNIAVITVSNGAASITNGNIKDNRGYPLVSSMSIGGGNNTLTNVPASTHRSNNGATVNETAAKIQTGWGAVTVGSTVNQVSTSITFPVAFTNIPMITVSCGGDQASGTVALGNGGNIIQGLVAAKHVIDTTTGTLIYLSAIGNWTAGNIVYFTWIAIGV
jgi:hypothetical protein